MTDDTLDVPAWEPAKPVVPEKQAAVVYVGPNLVKPYPVGHLTVFRGELPPPLAKFAKDNADFAACLVPVANIGASLAALMNPASALARAAHALKPKARKEG